MNFSEKDITHIDSFIYYQFPFKSCLLQTFLNDNVVAVVVTAKRNTYIATSLIDFSKPDRPFIALSLLKFSSAKKNATNG